VFFGALFSHNLQVAGFAAKQAAIEAGSDASPAKIAVKEWDVPTPNPIWEQSDAHWDIPNGLLSDIAERHPCAQFLRIVRD
jgi:hypothetical protein